MQKSKTGCACGCHKDTVECDCDIVHKDKVQKAKKEMLNDDILLMISDLFKAMSDSTRIKIISILEKQEMCVCDIAVLLNMTKSAISHQLKNLKEMELIKSRREGKVVFYSLADEHVKQIFDISLDHIKEII